MVARTHQGPRPRSSILAPAPLSVRPSRDFWYPYASPLSNDNSWMEDAFLPESGQVFRLKADSVSDRLRTPLARRDAVSDVETFRILGFDWPICRASLWSFNTQILLLETRFERTETGSISRPVL